jgi:adenine-specific DNA methylase
MVKEPRLEISTEKVIVIDNIPVVGTDKKDKLKKVLGNLINHYGKIINEYYPENENGVLKGLINSEHL